MEEGANLPSLLDRASTYTWIAVVKCDTRSPPRDPHDGTQCRGYLRRTSSASHVETVYEVWGKHTCEYHILKHHIYDSYMSIIYKYSYVIHTYDELLV